VPTPSTVEQPSTTLTPATTTGATTVAPIPCQPTVDFLQTRSGRRVLLRATGLTGPSPTIIVIHGYTGTPSGIETYAELTERANASGIAVAYPEGSPTPHGGLGWNSGAAVLATELVDDLTVLGEMIDAMVMTGCVDPAQIILTGESNGAAMALVAACAPQLATRFTRVVLVNAAVDTGVLQRCSSSTQAVPLTVVAGAHDETTPLEGNDNFLPVDEWFTSAASQLTACPTIQPAPPLDAVVSRSVGTGCAACTELLVITDGTHTWPGTSHGVSSLIPGTFELNAMLIDAPSAPPASCLTGR
jgi:poly(3-hydroxybutyrate) depolymerase